MIEEEHSLTDCRLLNARSRLASISFRLLCLLDLSIAIKIVKENFKEKGIFLRVICCLEEVVKWPKTFLVMN
ncbi:MAG: hypothetical protein KBB01_04975 [Candidatus Omnitrophica bacterium]|jgi:hypothetical protein|nr:hypothetical protein [Candidatus Omnitrophota bacterium]